jgi:hypothetical protein
MVRLSIVLSAASVRGAEDLVEGLLFLARTTRLEKGCIGCSAWSDPDSTVHYVEDWAAEPYIRRRVLSDPFTSLLTVVESAHGVDVQFQFVSESRGLDYITEVRQHARRLTDPKQESEQR